MNIPQLEKLVKQYREDKSVIFAMPNYAQETSCGTALCIAGQQCANEGYELRIVLEDYDYSEPEMVVRLFVDGQETDASPWEVAAGTLGLAYAQAARLFRKNDWPEKFRYQPDTPALAADRIQHFIDTQGAE